MALISYPRTAAELRSVLSLGYKEVLRLLRANKLRVNLYGFLNHLFKENKFNDRELDRLNAKLFAWHEARSLAGNPCGAMVYHHSGVRVLHGFTIRMVEYERKADREQYKKERKNEFNKVRQAWLKSIAATHYQEPSEIQKMADWGKCPSDANGLAYQVHHRMPLDDGGTNAFDNLILVRDDVEHRAVHGYYNPAELRIERIPYGDKACVALPVPPHDTLIYPNPARGYVSEIVPHADLLEIYDEH
jgi:hypothetical protein